MRRLWIASGLAGYLAAALFLTWPLAAEWTRAVPSHWEADVVHQLWLQWWFERALDAGLPLFHTDVIQYPHGVDLQLADLNLAVVGAFWLLERAVGTLPAWNLLLLGSLVASGGSTWALAARACGRGDAGWLAGLCFAASAGWKAIALNAWLSLAQLFVLPLGLLALARAVRSARLRDAAWAGAALGLAFHVTPYYLVFLLGLAAALAPWHLRALRAELRERRGALRAAVGAAVCLALVLPRALPMWRAAQQQPLAHSGPADLHLATRPLEWLWPWSAPLEAFPQWGFRGVYVGALLCALCVVGYALGPRRRVLPWLAGAALFALLSFGAYAEPFGLRVPLPGALLGALPGVSLLTNPWRFALPALLCLCLAGAFGAAALAQRLDLRTPGAGRVLLLALALLQLLDVGYAPPFPPEAPLWRAEPAPIALALRDDAEGGAVLDLSRHAKRNQLVHGRPIVGGWLPRLPRAAQARTDRLVAEILSAPRAERAAALGRLGIRAEIEDDTHGWRVVADPAQPGGYREERIDVAAPGARR